MAGGLLTIRLKVDRCSLPLPMLAVDLFGSGAVSDSFVEP